MTNNLSSLNSALASNKFAQAKQTIKDYLKNKWSAADNGAAYCLLASTYLKVNNAINRRYKDSLDDAIEILENINQRKTKVKDAIRVNQLRKEINF